MQQPQEPENVRRRRDRANISREVPGLKGPAAKNVKTKEETFGLYLIQDIINITLMHTNRKLTQDRTKFIEKDEQRKEFILAPIDETELRAFLGMTVLRGTHSLTVDHMFSPKHGPALFRATMGKERYLAILSHVSFDNAETRNQRRRGDKFCIMREVFSLFDKNLRRHVTPSDDMTIDESLIKYRGGAHSVYTEPEKPGRYGILVRTVADAHSRYLWEA